MTAVVLPTLPPDIRARCEATIERLIAFLDQFEPDTDLEPSLGSYPGHLPWDAEADDDGEPSLGSPESVTCPAQRFVPISRETYDRMGDQTHWNQGGGEDCEYDPGESGIADDDGLNEQMSIFGGNVGDMRTG